jgi:type II secretory pathway component PulF
LFFVIAMMVAVLTFLMIKIVPEMEQIFDEFDTRLPMITELAVGVSYMFTRYLGVPIVIALVVLLLGLSIAAVCYLADVPMLRPWGELVFRGRTTAHVLRILAVATRERQSLARALIWLAHVYPSATIRRRLSGAASAVNSGIDWRDALADAEIVTPSEQGLLKAAERAGNLPWALQQIAKRRERRAVYRWATVLQIAYPAAILLLGGFVAFYVIALFVPIVQLIQSLA